VSSLMHARPRRRVLTPTFCPFAAAKNHQHSAANPYSQFRNKMTTAEVMADKKVTDNVRSPSSPVVRD
jgi:hypothetical protein